MSFQAMRWAMEQALPTPGAKLLLVALANHAGPGGVCSISQATLAEESAQSTRSVQLHLQALEEAGLVEVLNQYRRNKSQGSNRYRLPVREQREESAHCNAKDLRIAGGKAKNLHAAGGEQCEESSPPVPTVLEPVTTTPPAPPAGGEPETDDFEEAWDRFPKRAGGNPKKAARKAWEARRREGVPAEELLEGVLRYSAYVQATDRAGTEFVMQAATFFGPNERWRDEYQLPARAGPNCSGGPEKHPSEMSEAEFLAYEMSLPE